VGQVRSVGPERLVGQTVAGVLREETGTSLTISTGAGESRTVQKADIAGRTNHPSSMPPMGLILTRRELRDLVEYLAGQTDQQ
jgi:quinoprotein glucose dehydrogenase